MKFLEKSIFSFFYKRKNKKYTFDKRYMLLCNMLIRKKKYLPLFEMFQKKKTLQDSYLESTTDVDFSSLTRRLLVLIIRPAIWHLYHLHMGKTGDRDKSSSDSCS